MRGSRKDIPWQLVEAMRRFIMFHPKEDMTKAWTGLGKASDYKSVISKGYMKPLSENKGYDVWLHLTEAGASIVRFWIDAHLITEASFNNFNLKPNILAELTPIKDIQQ